MAYAAHLFGPRPHRPGSHAPLGIFEFAAPPRVGECITLPPVYGDGEKRPVLMVEQVVHIVGAHGNPAEAHVYCKEA